MIERQDELKEEEQHHASGCLSGPSKSVLMQTKSGFLLDPEAMGGLNFLLLTICFPNTLQ